MSLSVVFQGITAVAATTAAVVAGLALWSTLRRRAPGVEVRWNGMRNKVVELKVSVFNPGPDVLVVDRAVVLTRPSELLILSAPIEKEADALRELIAAQVRSSGPDTVVNWEVGPGDKITPAFLVRAERPGEKNLVRQVKLRFDQLDLARPARGSPLRISAKPWPHWPGLGEPRRHAFGVAAANLAGAAAAGGNPGATSDGIPGRAGRAVVATGPFYPRFISHRATPKIPACRAPGGRAPIVRRR